MEETGVKSDEEACDGGAGEEVVEEADEKEVVQQGKVSSGTGQGSRQKEANGTVWQLMWVRIEEDGQPHYPLQVKEAMGGRPIPGPAPGTPYALSVPGTPAVTFAFPTPKAAPRTPSVLMAPGTPTATSPRSEFKGMLKELTGALTKAVAPPAPSGKKEGELEEPGPKLRLTSEAKAWDLSQRKDDVQRMAWPLKPNKKVPLESFKVFLETQCGLGKSSVEQNVRLIGYVYGMFHLPTQFSQEGFWASVYLSGMADTWANLQIMSPSIPNTSNISTAMNHLIDHLTMHADRARHREASRCLNGLKKEVLIPLHNKVQAAKAEALQVNREKDAEKLEQLPPQDVLKAAVKDTMVALHWAEEKAKSGEGVDGNLKACANALMAGIVFCNSYAGRPGEWTVLERTSVEALLESGKDWIRMYKHKTSKVYGSAGRAVSSGLKEGMKAMLKIHPSSAKYFFDPARSTTTAVTMSVLLDKWSETFTPGYQNAGATLQRKLMHTVPQKDEVAQLVFREICKYDKHKTNTGLRNYVAADLENEAKKGAIIFRNVLGDPVEWPSAEEVAAGKAKALKTLEDMYSRAKKAKEDGENDEEGEEDEAGFGGEEGGEEEEEAAEGLGAGGAQDDAAVKGFEAAMAQEGEGEQAVAHGMVDEVVENVMDGDGKEVVDEATNDKAAEAAVQDEAPVGDGALQEEAVGEGEAKHGKGDGKQVVDEAMKDKADEAAVQDEAPVGDGAMQEDAVGDGEAKDGKGVKPAGEGTAVVAQVEAVAGLQAKCTLSTEEEAWVEKQHQKQLKKEGKPKDAVALDGFFKALKMIGCQHGFLRFGTSTKVLKEAVELQSRKRKQQPVEQGTPKEDAQVKAEAEAEEQPRKRRKITQGLQQTAANAVSTSLSSSSSSSNLWLSWLLTI